MTSNAPMYVYATEMVSVYYSKLNIDDKTILTISGSGDQVLNAYYYGAKKVLAFDINNRSAYIAQMKFAAVKTLSYSEFLSFFGDKYNNGSMDYKLYKKISPMIDRKARSLFDSLYKRNLYSGKGIITSEKYFRQRGSFPLKPPGVVNAYLNSSKNYSKLKHILETKKLVFMQSDIINLNKKVHNSNYEDKKFHLINISNVIIYLSRSTMLDDPEKYIISLLIKLGKNLKKDGRILFYGYSRSYGIGRTKIKGIPLVSRKSFLDKIKKETNFIVEENRISGVHTNTMDRMIALRKK